MIRSKDLPREMREKLGIKQRKPKGARQPNGWEKEYASQLEGLRRFAETQNRVGIIYYQFEAVRLMLPGGVIYTPDFWVIIDLGNGRTFQEFHEVKGRKMDGGMARFKIARASFPWAKFMMVTRVRPGVFEEVSV